uniref:NADH-ubiquinone oxidoreductase chain 6 n=1 Tax=Manocoreus sp. TaxID=2931905 RepID=A0A8T9VX88_9HEMI|nr:NADH dehydrogenase subunit 6 [Manocoreus sp.]
MIMLFMLLIMSSIMFMCLKHPISMGINIIMMTLIISMITGLIMGSFWFSYILTITMLSGMLVLFIYMASVASNEKFYTSSKLIMLLVFLLLMSMITQMYFQNYENELINISQELSTENLSLNNLFNCKFKYITMTMVMYLLFTMITVSFIVNVSEGPLRINKK